MALISYKGTGRPCSIRIVRADGTPLGNCRNMASRGSDLCLMHKHMRKANEVAKANRRG